MNYRRTKIVATFGPSTISKSMVEKMIIAGVDVARINMSHHSENIDIDNLVKNIRDISKKLDRSVSIMMDLPGPKVRTSNEEIISIKRGNSYTLGLNAEIPLNAQLKFKEIQKNFSRTKVVNFKIFCNLDRINVDVAEIKSI